MQATPRTGDRILRFPEVARRTGLSRSTLWRLQRQGKFPRPRRIAPNANGWLESEIDTWVSQTAKEHS